MKSEGFCRVGHGVFRGRRGLVLGAKIEITVSVISVSSVVDGLFHRLGQLLDVFFGGI